MNLQINGEYREFTETEISIEKLLEKIEIISKWAVVEVNKNIIGRDSYSEYLLKDGDVVEIIVPMSGG